MLKIAVIPEEKFGGRLMRWWDGDGAARIYAHDDDAVLIERAQGKQSLLAMALNGEDDEASRIICETISSLHKPRDKRFPDLVPLDHRFRALEPAARSHGGILRTCAAIAKNLLSESKDVVALHGDIHHGNILDFEDGGWLAIDPKGLRGERGYDYANLFCNPDLATTQAPERLRRQLPIAAAESGLSPERLLRWIIAHAGLSASWFIEDDEDPARVLRVADIAAAELANYA